MTATHAKLLHRTWCTACGAIATWGAILFLLGMTPAEFWGM